MVHITIAVMQVRKSPSEVLHPQSKKADLRKFKGLFGCTAFKGGG